MTDGLRHIYFFAPPSCFVGVIYTAQTSQIKLSSLVVFCANFIGQFACGAVAWKQSKHNPEGSKPEKYKTKQINWNEKSGRTLCGFAIRIAALNARSENKELLSEFSSQPQYHKSECNKLCPRSMWSCTHSKYIYRRGTSEEGSSQRRNAGSPE